MQRFVAVTLTLAIGATDGILAMADGLRVRPTADPDSPEVIGEDDIKLLAVPHTPAVVMSSGRATYRQVHISKVLLRVLCDGDASSEPRDLEDLAIECAGTLSNEHEATPSRYHARLLVVGYDEEGQLTAFRVDVPSHDFGDGLGSTTVHPVAVDPAFPVLANPAETETGASVLFGCDRFADFYDELSNDVPSTAEAHRFAGMTLSEVRPAAMSSIRDWLSKDAPMAASDGVGGLWSVAEIRPGEAARVEHGLRLDD